MNEMKAKSKQAAARRELHRKLTVILDSNRLAASALTSTINNAYLAATNPQEYQRLIDRVLLQARAKDVERLFEARTLQHGASLNSRPSENSLLSKEFSGARLLQARLVLHFAPDLADAHAPPLCEASGFCKMSR